MLSISPNLKFVNLVKIQLKHTLYYSGCHYTHEEMQQESLPPQSLDSLAGPWLSVVVYCLSNLSLLFRLCPVGIKVKNLSRDIPNE